MKLYRTIDGTWVGTQADAKNKNAIEVPVDKPGLLEWLNDNCRNDNRQGTSDDQESTDVACSHPPAPAAHLAGVDYDRLVAGMTADAMAEWVVTAPTGKVADFMVALADRIRQ